MSGEGPAIFEVEPESIACELGLEPGDRIIAINGHPVRDLIDYRFLEADESLNIEVRKSNGEDWILDVEKDYDQSLGIKFGNEGFGDIRRCINKCLFCFVDQMPPGMRKTLYIKDDDFRLSFWSGNFITLTNVSDSELRRIAGQRLSPLYISVHTTNPELRRQMLGSRRAGLILEQLRYLAGEGINVHTQVVLCPGFNDGMELERTAADLASLWPEVRSCAVVPVGLTRFRHGCYLLRGVTGEEARRLAQWVAQKQKEYMSSFNYPFIFAADEFYLMSGVPVPPSKRYADFPQTENGVGLVRLFLDEWERVRNKLPSELPPKKLTLATGVLGEMVLRPVVARLNTIKGLEVRLKAVKNKFFGERVTVAGLVTGKDLIDQIVSDGIGDYLVIPSVMMKKEEAVFLDDITLEDISGCLKTRVAAVEGPGQLVDVILNGLDKAKWFVIRA